MSWITGQLDALEIACPYATSEGLIGLEVTSNNTDNTHPHTHTLSQTQVSSHYAVAQKAAKMQSSDGAVAIHTYCSPVKQVAAFSQNLTD